MGDIADAVNEQLERARESKLNSAIALVVAVAATVMALGNVKDGNITQAMAQAQAAMVDQWSYYQAKGTKQNLAEATADHLEVQLATAGGLSPEGRAVLEKKIADYQSKARVYEVEKAEIKKTAEGYQATYDRLNYRDDQFDMGEACLSLCVAIMGITALTQRRWLFGFGMTFAVLGLLFEVAGFFGLPFHPDFLAKFLG